MSRRGRKRQLTVEDEYWALLLAGIGTVDACHRVGITRKTGYRWRIRPGDGGAEHELLWWHSGRLSPTLQAQQRGLLVLPQPSLTACRDQIKFHGTESYRREPQP